MSQQLLLFVSRVLKCVSVREFVWLFLPSFQVFFAFFFASHFAPKKIREKRSQVRDDDDDVFSNDDDDNELGVVLEIEHQTTPITAYYY